MVPTHRQDFSVCYNSNLNANSDKKKITINDTNNKMVKLSYIIFGIDMKIEQELNIIENIRILICVNGSKP